MRSASLQPPAQTSTPYRLTASDMRPSADRADLDDVARLLPPHDGQHGFGHRDRAEEVGLQLVAQFVELRVFDKTRD